MDELYDLQIEPESLLNHVRLDFDKSQQESEDNQSSHPQPVVLKIHQKTNLVQ